MGQTTNRTVIIGCGHMGSALARGLLGTALRPALHLIESSAARREYLAGQNGLTPHEGWTLAAELEIGPGDLIVLAIPPQLFGAFAAAEHHKFWPTTPVISVMAGLTSAFIASSLGTDVVIRAIPNTPSEVFEGMTVYFAGPEVSEDTVVEAERLLSSIGRVLRVDNEDLVDDATAICGGGPAFVSYIVDAFCEFAGARGFTEAASRAMVGQVFSGTATLIERSGKPPMQLCREVMTPNGTTERGIAAFDAAGLRSSLHDALAASADRSRELAVVLSQGTSG
jgi:pyrroline-5-carboxylate reductase